MGWEGSQETVGGSREEGVLKMIERPQSLLQGRGKGAPSWSFTINPPC